MIDNIYGKLALQVSSQVANDEQVNVKQLDPATIMIIIKVIWEVIQCYMKKKLTEQEALDVAKNPNFVQRGLLRVMTRKCLRSHDIPKVNKGVLRETITNKLVELGSTATLDQIRELVINFDETGKVLSGQQ